MTGRAVRVVTEVAALDRGFDYLVTERTARVGVGDRVRVNLHGRSVRGWVWSFEEPTGELKDLTKWLGLGPPPELLAVLDWAAWRWNGPRSRFALAASPERIVTALPPAPPPVDTAQPASWPRLAPGVIRLAPTADPLELVESALDATRERSGSLLVLLPTDAWSRRLVERLRRRGLAVAGPGEWERARSNWPVIVGARGAAFAPASSLRGAVVIDADDESYRSEAAPTWHAVEVVARRCAMEGSPLWVSSPMPSPWLSSLGAQSVAPDELGRWPLVVAVDRRRSDPHDGVLSAEALEAARRALDGDEPVALAVVLQRLGRGRLLACSSCGELVRCPQCGRAEHEVDGRLACDEHPEGRERFCANCSSTKLRIVRSGVTTLARDVSAQLAQDVTELTSASSESLALARVVVGTEAVLTRVRRATLVVFVDFDQYLLAPRSRARRDAVLAVARAGRLVGSRREGRGRVIVQTRRDDDPVVRALVDAELDFVIAQEDDEARVLGLAPYRAHATLSGDGAATFAAQLAEQAVTVSAVGDEFVVSAETTFALCDALAATPRPGERLRVAVE